MSETTPSNNVANRRQKRMGPAPFASFEDLSDELDSPDGNSNAIVRLPGIREDLTPSSTTGEHHFIGISLIGAGSSHKMSLQAPTTPRIDISRASSSSHHDSRDSTPDRELFESHQNPSSAKLGLGFGEEGTLDLRSSTEELDYQEKNKLAEAESASTAAATTTANNQRKDSQSSELGLLLISGRTSRLSSIGSAGSGQSRLSNASHLSVISGQTRSPSPHKMLLETSFCGYKTPECETNEPGTKTEVLEKVLLSRRSDPNEAILAEGISPPEPPPPTPPPQIKCVQSAKNLKSDITIKVDEPTPPPPPPPPSSNNNSGKAPPRKIISKSGVEYIYIPLKGPLPLDDSTTTSNHKTKVRQVKSATTTNPTSSTTASKPRAQSATPSPLVQKRNDDPKYIRIRLKPDYMYSDEDRKPITDAPEPPATLDLVETKPPPLLPPVSLSSTPSASPKLARRVESKTPSPSLSRKSSFASLFRSKEAIISPESPTVPSRRKSTLTGILRDASENMRERSRSRSRSKSRERDKSLSAAPSSTESIDSKTKQKSVFSIFKATPKKSCKDEEVSNVENVPIKVEFKFNERPLEGDSIRIPLHSPTHYDDEVRTILQDLKTAASSQDSQETVIEVKQHVETAIIENNATNESNISKQTIRQSSTSSENVVFSTNLGSCNEIFTTKLPKDNNKTNNKQQVEVTVETNGNESDLNLELQEPEIKETIYSETKPQQQPAALPEPPQLATTAIEIKPQNSDCLYSSESERDSEVDFPLKSKRDLDLKLELDYEPERKGLVLQQDSYEDDLPYVPTTLPMERSAAVPIVPVKQRSTFEMKTYPIERPRSTTPINPSCLEEYCEEGFSAAQMSKTIEKLKISLPDNKPIKSPRVTGNWYEFAEKGINTGRRSSQEADTPPPLPPKGQQPPPQKEWINFEEIPERRKPPKRIQTLPSRGHIEVPDSVLHQEVIYNYVNPEECKCECHEITREKREQQQQQQEQLQQQEQQQEDASGIQEDELPLLEDDEDKSDAVDRIKLDVALSDRRSVISDSSVDLSTSVEQAPEVNGDLTLLRTPFTSDLGLSSNRSSIVSQVKDESPSPDSGSPNAFPKIS